MDVKKLIYFITGIFLLCGILIVGIFFAPFIEMQLKENLIAEIVGGGILGSIVAGIFFYLQEADEYQTNKRTAKSFYDDKLILDLKEAFDRNPSPWNFNGLQKFYFDNSRINSLYDIYQNNFSDINEYDAYFPENELISLFNELYRKVRKGYVLGEKLEGEIYQLVREEHHKRQLIAANDFYSQAYIKGQLFAGLPDATILRYLEWQSIPERIPLIIETAKSKKEIMELIGKIQKVRKDILKKEAEIKKLVRKIPDTKSH